MSVSSAAYTNTSNSSSPAHAHGQLKKSRLEFYEPEIQSRKEHHLIRCPASEKADEKVSTTEQRLTLIEGYLKGMHTELDGLNARMGNILKLLQRLVGAPEGRAASFHRPSRKTRAFALVYMGS